jgi:ATP-dependent RNA helicase DHX37/DHR1
LPPGSILVFLTGKREIIAMCKRIKKRFKSKQTTTEKDASSSSGEEGEEEGDYNKSMKKNKKQKKVRGDISKIVEGSGVDDEGDVRDMDMDEEEFDKAEDDDEIHEEEGEDDEDDNDSDNDDDGEGYGGPVEVHPLYAMLSNQDQSSVFATPKNPNARMIIVATNVAETSITIPGIT